MRKFLILSLLATTIGCNQDIRPPERTNPKIENPCDVYTHGICLIFQLNDEPPPDIEAIEHAIGLLDLITEEDLPTLFAEVGVEVRWLPADKMEYRGFTATNAKNIYMKYSDLCIDQAYVLAHELLHIYSHHVLKVDSEANFTHQIDGVFVGDYSMDIEIYNQMKNCTPEFSECVNPELDITFNKCW